MHCDPNRFFHIKILPPHLFRKLPIESEQRFASASSTSGIEKFIPGHPLLPEPNGNSSKCCPLKSTWLFENRSGKNLSGLSQSVAIAAALKKPLVFAGISYWPLIVQSCVVSLGICSGAGGWSLSDSLITISTDPVYWENPERFWPDRFINSQVDFRGQHFELLPFGAGRRGCPGINFSIPLVELALTNLLFRFDWKLAEGVLAEDLDMEEEPGITMRKKVPLLLVASPMN